MPLRRSGIAGRCLRVLLLLCLATPLAAKKPVPHATPKEHVLLFDAHIVVNPDTSMRVVETIQLQTAAIKIQRFLNRDIPTTYTDESGNKLSIRVDVASVERDGSPEAYHVDPRNGGLRISCGDSGRTIPPGLHTYVFTYDVGRQLEFLPDHDELFWNVTGTAWELPMDAVTATVTLPSADSGKPLTLDGYTGTSTNQAKAFASAQDAQGNAVFRAEHLSARQGLAIVVAWPKGLVAPPSPRKRWIWFLKDHGAVVTAALGLAAILLYYILAWMKVGRDPESGKIVPSGEPPRELSPAAMRYLEQMQFDARAFAASVLNLAARGVIRVEYMDPAGYRLVRKENAEEQVKLLAPDEKMLAKKLFESGNTLSLTAEKQQTIQQARRALELSLHTRMEGAYFVTNARYLWPGLIMTIGTMAAVAVMGTGGFSFGRALFMTLLLTLCTMAVSVLLAVVYKAWRSAATSAFLGMAGAIVMTLLCLPLLAAEAVGAFMLWESGSPATFFLVFAALAANVLFYYLLKRPTSAGRKLLDQIEGFKLFLNGVKRSQQPNSSPIDITAVLYERLLPYAIALGIENRWTEQFVDVLTPGPDSPNGSFAPSWYAGGSFVMLPANAFDASFAMSFTSVLDAVSSEESLLAGSEKAKPPETA